MYANVRVLVGGGACVFSWINIFRYLNQSLCERVSKYFTFQVTLPWINSKGRFSKVHSNGV